MEQLNGITKMSTSSEKGIIVFDEISLVRFRTNHLFQDYDIHVFGATNELELYNLLANKELNIGLVIMDIGFDANSGFEIISKIKEKYNVPVFILTANSKRQTFIRGIAEGASDYILKPFEDDYLLQKVVRILDKKKLETTLHSNSGNELVFDVQSYINTELKKAEKGKYEITIIMISFFIPVKEVDVHIEQKYIQVSELFYEKFKNVLWNTDILEQYGSQTFIGVFPYCGVDNTDKLRNKLMVSFEDVKKENKEVDFFQLAISTITYPSEAKNAKELLSTLGLRIKNEIEEIKEPIV